MMYRRQLLVSVAVAFAPAGCTFDQTVATVASDIQLIAAALPGVLANLKNLGLPWLTNDVVSGCPEVPSPESSRSHGASAGRSGRHAAAIDP